MYQLIQNGIGKKIIHEIEKEVENKTKKGQKCSINLVSISGKEEFYEKCGFKKIPFDYTGYGMIKRIERQEVINMSIKGNENILKLVNPTMEELEKMVEEKVEGLLLHDEEFKKLFEYI